MHVTLGIAQRYINMGSAVQSYVACVLGVWMITAVGVPRTILGFLASVISGFVAKTRLLPPFLVGMHTTPLTNIKYPSFQNDNLIIDYFSY